MKSLWIPTIALTAVLFVSPAQAGRGISVETALEKADAAQAIARANEWKWSRKDVKSYVTPEKVIFEFPDGSITRIALPEEKQMVALAPYLRETHPCATHYTSSCQGELAEQPFSVKAVDPEGHVLIDEVMTTGKNGFIELWLPRDRQISLEIRQGNLIARNTIGTFADSKTCVTTFQLQGRGADREGA